MKVTRRFANYKLFWMSFLGFIAALFFLLAPLHEFYHAAVSLLHGYFPEIHWSYIITGDHSLLVYLIGPFGELISFGALFVLLVWKERIYLASFMIGYMMFNVIIYTAPWFMVGDFETAIVYHQNQEEFIRGMYQFCRILNYTWEGLAISAIRELKKRMEKKEVKLKPCPNSYSKCMKIV